MHELAPGRHRKAIAAEATRVKRMNVIELNLSTETGVSKLPGRHSSTIARSRERSLSESDVKGDGRVGPLADIPARHGTCVAMTRSEAYLKNCSTSVMF